jgi:hypothetical protein
MHFPVTVLTIFGLFSFTFASYTPVDILKAKGWRIGCVHLIRGIAPQRLQNTPLAHLCNDIYLKGVEPAFVHLLQSDAYTHDDFVHLLTLVQAVNADANPSTKIDFYKLGLNEPQVKDERWSLVSGSNPSSGGSSLVSDKIKNEEGGSVEYIGSPLLRFPRHNANSGLLSLVNIDKESNPGVIHRASRTSSFGAAETKSSIADDGDEIAAAQKFADGTLPAIDDEPQGREDIAMERVASLTSQDYLNAEEGRSRMHEITESDGSADVPSIYPFSIPPAIDTVSDSELAVEPIPEVGSPSSNAFGGSSTSGSVPEIELSVEPELEVGLPSSNPFDGPSTSGSVSKIELAVEPEPEVGLSSSNPPSTSGSVSKTELAVEPELETKQNYPHDSLQANPNPGNAHHGLRRRLRRLNREKVLQQPIIIPPTNEDKGKKFTEECEEIVKRCVGKIRATKPCQRAEATCQRAWNYARDEFGKQNDQFQQSAYPGRLQRIRERIRQYWDTLIRYGKDSYQRTKNWARRRFSRHSTASYHAEV